MMEVSGVKSLVVDSKQIFIKYVFKQNFTECINKQSRSNKCGNGKKKTNWFNVRLNFD